MEVDKAIKERRSIRKYLKKDVSDDLVCEVLDAARYAPSAGNIQNWKFIVVKDEVKRKELATCCLNQSWMLQAPVFIIVCNNLTGIKRLYKERGEKLYSIQNCAAAVQTILLRAHSLGLGSCWVGAFDAVGIKRVLKIPDMLSPRPESVEPQAIITLGYSHDKIFQIPHRHGLDELTFIEEWGNKRKDFGMAPISKHAVKIEGKTEGIVSKIKDMFSSDK